MKIKQQWFARGFQVGHQKVFVDVDFTTKTLEGWTEITIVPLSAAVDSAAFHCWQSEITNCEVDGHGASWQHVDGLQDLQLREQSSSVHQSDSLRSKLASLNRTINKCDLHIRFPAGVKVTVQDSDMGQATHNMRSSGANENGNEEEIEVATPAVMPTPMTPFGHGPQNSIGKIQYKTITVKIWFRCTDPVLGARFVNCDESANYPHMYTTNSPVPCNTSLWCPCLDGIWERSTWEMTVSIPKTLGAIRRRINYQNDSNNSFSNGIPNTSEEQAQQEDAADTKDSTEMHVVCSADFIEEKTDVRDSSRKVITFAQGFPVGASHMSFTAGPFQEYVLSELREPEEEDLLGPSAVDVHVYCLPGRLADMKTTCYPIYKAMDFFVKDFGSFPFTNYQICFVQDMELDSVYTAGMAITSDRLLYNDRMIEPIYPVTKTLVVDLASQWIGVNIVPRSWSDTWLILGIAHFMTGLFLKRLMGNNDYRFRLKQDMVRVTEQDIGKPPLSSRALEIPIDPRQTTFIALKSSVVLHLLEQRLTRAGRTLGLGRIIPRIFLQALSGELPNGILSTEKFLKQCEKLAPVKLDEFARQWIYGYGYPKFSVVQRFNKKKMVIEMGIRQQQFQDSNRPPLRENTFIDEAYRNMMQPPIGPVDAIFTGPLTIRIHESDGTPYEHIIELKDQFHKFDIPYNNKYRKRVRTRKAKTKEAADAEAQAANNEEPEDDNTESDQVYCLGNGFQAENDQETWHLEEWSKEDEDKMSGESFEWLRVDSGFEWICTMQVGQPDYMYHSQLQQDRDVVAQFEAVQYFASVKPSAVTATILFRTLMDERYYYGIRQMAAQALARCAILDLDFVGEYQLMSSFRHLYCFPDAHRFVPFANDFTDIANYLVRTSLLSALLVIRPKGYASEDVRFLFIEQLKHNDNSENAYDDSHYVAHLIDCLVDAFVHLDNQHMPNLNRDRELKADLDKALAEIDRCQRMDRWRPSYQNLVTRATLSGKERLMQAGMLPTSYKEFMDYTREDHNTAVRLQGFSSLLNLGALRYPALGKYILFTQNQDPSAFVKHQMSILLEHGVGAMALRGRRSRYGTHTDVDAMIIEEDTSAAVELRKDRESRSTIEGAVVVLRDEFRDEETVKDYLWRATNDWRAGLLARRNLLDVCKVMFEIKESRVLKFRLPKYKARLMCLSKGNGRLVIKRTRPLERYQKRAPVKSMKIKLKLTNSAAMKKE